jgi:glucose-6-phosphate-specific signal transduction histidine kinase
MFKLRTIIAVAAIAYLGSYLVFRSLSQEVWAKDNQVYVIFPTGSGLSLYYLWRPLMLMDAKLTGMNFHIGPHQE